MKKLLNYLIELKKNTTDYSVKKISAMKLMDYVEKISVIKDYVKKITKIKLNENSYFKFFYNFLSSRKINIKNKEFFNFFNNKLEVLKIKFSVVKYFFKFFGKLVYENILDVARILKNKIIYKFLIHFEKIIVIEKNFLTFFNNNLRFFIDSLFLKLYNCEIFFDNIKLKLQLKLLYLIKNLKILLYNVKRSFLVSCVFIICLFFFYYILTFITLLSINYLKSFLDNFIG